MKNDLRGDLKLPPILWKVEC